MKKIVFVILLLFSLSAKSQNIQTNNGLLKASEAYGFFIGQEYTLGKIKDKYPELKLQAVQVELTFNKTFGQSRKNIENFFIKKFGTESIKDLQNSLIDKFKTLDVELISSKEEAINFIAEVNKRASGEISSPNLETILTYQYYDNPQREFFDSFIIKYFTKNFEKSKGADWSLKIPKSWVPQEADRPNILQKFNNEGGIGNEFIMILIKNLPDGTKLKKNEIAELFTEKEIKDFVPDKAKFISFKQMTFDGLQGGALEYEQTVTRLDLKIKLRLMNFIFIYNNQINFLQCSVSGLENENLTLAMEKFTPLFKLVANSIVINQKY